MMKINLRHAKVWSDIPDFWKLTKRVNKVSYKPEPKDKGLVSIMSVYASDDDLRPVMTGINFDDKCIVSTDAHKLFTLPNTGKERGLFEIGSDKKIDGNFPNYELIFPTSVASKFYVNIQKLKTFCNVVVNGNYSNLGFKTVRLFAGKTDHIRFNVEFLVGVLDGFEKLGYTDIYLGYVSPTKNLVFSINEKDLNNPLSALGKNPIAILMPVYDAEYEETGPKIAAQDQDLDTSLLVNYDLEQDQIINADGQPVKNWEPITDWGIPYWNKDEARVVKKITESKDYLPILTYATVKDGILTASNLDITYSLTGVDVVDGVYEITNLALKDLPQSESNLVDDLQVGFRYDQKFNIKGYLKSGIEAIAQASIFVGKDQLRPAMNGVHLRVKDGTESVQATNAYYILNLNKPILNAANDYDVILGELKLLVPALETFDSPIPKIATDLKYEIVKFIDVSERHHVWVKAIDARYPDVKNAIPKEVDLLYALNIAELKNLLKSVPSKLKDSILYFTFENNVAKAIISTDGVEKEIGKLSGYMKDVNRDLPENYVGIMPNLSTEVGGDKPSLKLTVEYALKFFDVAFRYGQKEGGNLMIYSKAQQYVKWVEVENEFDKIPQSTAPPVSVKPPKVTPKQAAPEPVKTPAPTVPSKKEVEATINALKYLADAGNEDAKKTVKALSILIENM